VLSLVRIGGGRRPQAGDNVQLFSTALLKGLEAAVADPDEAGTILQKYAPTAGPGSAAAELTVMAPYVRGSGGPLGTVLAERLLLPWVRATTSAR
jgi:NitT/TauT family transport system substrate-binding protein